MQSSNFECLYFPVPYVGRNVKYFCAEIQQILSRLGSKVLLGYDNKTVLNFCAACFFLSFLFFSTAYTTDHYAIYIYIQLKSLLDKKIIMMINIPTLVH